MSKNAGTSSPRKPKSSSADGARAIATTVLNRVWHEGAWAAPALDAELRRHPQLDPRDGRLATELSYGVLRTQRVLEREISRHTENDKWRRQEAVHAAMCIAAYAILFLDKVPDFAAVDEAVEAVKRAKGRRVGGFVNAVLRKLVTAPRPGSLEQAIVEALPAWLSQALAQSVGDVTPFMTAALPAPMCLCLRRGEDRDAWIAQLRQAHPGAQIEAGALSPRCIVTRGLGDQRAVAGHDGAWIVQEEGAQLLAMSVGAREGETILDACAGRGGKTLWLCESVAPGGAVDAADLHPRKLERLAATPAGRLVRAQYAVDWEKGVGQVPEGYDRVLVDAPCSGTGTLRRRPEIVSRLGASDVARMAALQIAVTKRAASRLRPGGRLIYAVCSVLPAECEAVVDALLADESLGLQRAPFDVPLPPGVEGQHAFRLLPHVHGTDGYFAASFIRESLAPHSR